MKRSSSGWRVSSLPVCLLAASLGLAGCESVQRKFTRKPKGPVEKPTPIINFQDYTGALTPIDRYRKHYLMYDYWNGELVSALEQPQLNAKRYKHASGESLVELRTLRDLLADGPAGRLSPIIDRRAELDRRLQRGLVNEAQLSLLRRDLEAQAREFQHGFYWRDVEDQLKLAPAPAAEEAP